VEVFGVFAGRDEAEAEREAQEAEPRAFRVQRSREADWVANGG
jgi:hypothetical protein